MEFKPIPCHESLRPFIRNYWMLTAHCTATGTQQIFSNGAASLQFYLTQSVWLDCGQCRYRTVLFHQNMQKVGIVTAEGAFHVFGVEFVPFCSRVFFRNEMNTLYASPEELHDEELTMLSQKIYDADSVEERVSLLDDFFMKRLAEFPEGDVDKEYDRAIEMGVKPIMKPTTEPWGQRTCYVADPEGNLIEISSFNE